MRSLQRTVLVLGLVVLTGGIAQAAPAFATSGIRTLPTASGTGTSTPWSSGCRTGNFRITQETRLPGGPARDQQAGAH